MKTAAIKILLSAMILTALTASAGLAQKQVVRFHWSPSPVLDENNVVLPEAVKYEVWLRRLGEFEELVDIVPDTVYTLEADMGVVQQIRVRGVDANSQRSAPSVWSEPFYFQNSSEVVTVPPGPQLKANYPNPFNPETRIVYGIPVDIQSKDQVRLEIFTVQGHRVRTLPVDRSPGWHEAVWDGKDDRGMVTSTGMYVTRFAVGDKVKTGKMTMVK